jgi:circadian clock protein KaiB
MKTKKRSANGQTKNKYVFHLYVTGASPNSVRAIANTKKICEQYFHNYELEIIDVYQQPQIAQRENIIALPLLVKKFPLPEKRFIGAVADTEKLLSSMGISTDLIQL